MKSLLLGLCLALAIPLGALSGSLRPRARRPFRVFWLVVALAGWGVVALSVAPADLAGGTVRALILVAVGFLYIEGVLVVARGRRRAESETPPRALAVSESNESSDEADERHADDEPDLPPEAIELEARIVACERIPVEQVMTPRERIVWVDASTPLRAVLERMKSASRARLLVVDGTLERVVGVAHAKDLLPLVVEGQAGALVRHHLRRALHVPQGRSVAGLLDDFRRGRVHLGVVSDNKGRTLGIVTQRDVFAYLAGSKSGSPDGRASGASG